MEQPGTLGMGAGCQTPQQAFSSCDNWSFSKPAFKNSCSSGWNVWEKNAEDQWANSQGKRERRRETRYFSPKTFHKIKPKGIMYIKRFSLNRRALTHRKVGKYKEDYEIGFTRLKKRLRLKSLRSTVRSGRSKCRQFPALETEFGFQSNAYIHFEWKKRPNHPVSEELEGISNQDLNYRTHCAYHICSSCIFYSVSGCFQCGFCC